MSSYFSLKDLCFAATSDVRLSVEKGGGAISLPLSTSPLSVTMSCQADFVHKCYLLDLLWLQSWNHIPPFGRVGGYRAA